MLMTEGIWVWIAGVLTLAIYSFLYTDNPLYKIAEHIFVGISAGYGVVIVYQESVKPDLVNPLLHPSEVGLAHPNYLVLIPGALGLLMFSRFFRRYDWLSRWPIAFVILISLGQASTQLKIVLQRQTPSRALIISSLSSPPLSLLSKMNRCAWTSGAGPR